MKSLLFSTQCLSVLAWLSITNEVTSSGRYVVVLVTPLSSVRIARPYHVPASKPPILANHPPKSIDGNIGKRVRNIWHIRVLKSLNCAHNKKH